MCEGQACLYNFWQNIYCLSPGLKQATVSVELRRGSHRTPSRCLQLLHGRSSIQRLASVLSIRLETYLIRSSCYEGACGVFRGLGDFCASKRAKKRPA